MSLEWSTGLGRWLLAAIVLSCAAPAAAQQQPRIDPQDLGEIYADLRFRKEFARLVGGHGRPVPLREMEHVAVLSDSLGVWILRQAFDYLADEDPDWTGEVLDWHMISADSSVQHRSEFVSTKWAFLGANYFTALDTTATPVLRAYLESRFGSPTRTLASGGGIAAAEGMQFEYWFHLNDSIRVMVMDATGPLDRGIIFAGDQRFRDFLFNLRQSFLGDLLLHEEPAPYIDYYYSPVSGWWYETGYDGGTFFTERIRRPRLEDGPPQLSPRH